MDVLRYWQVDAFATQPMTGNPAGVALLPYPVPAALMQAIAAETGLVTAFLLARHDLYELQWFTPLVAEAMCGHGTIAAAWVVFNRLEPERTSVHFATPAGALAVCRQDDAYCLDLPARLPEPCAMPPGLSAALGAAPTAVLSATSYIAVFDDAEAVARLAPDMGRLAALDLPGVVVTAPGGGFGCDIASRYFAPAKGIPEDPVTGSAHAQVVPYWSRRLARKHLLARQLSRRGGTIACEDRATHVRLTAAATLFLEGSMQIDLPADQSTVSPSSSRSFR